MPPKPRIQIPVHVFVYTIAFLPGAAYAYHWYKNAPSEEEYEAELRKNYTHNIEQSRDKHAQMTTFLQGMKDPNSDQQKKMDEVLLGGRGKHKRLAAVDENIYGTEEALKLQKEAQQRAKKGKRKKKKKKHGSDADDKNQIAMSNVEDIERSTRVKQSVAAMAAVGALAAATSFFLGGKRPE